MEFKNASDFEKFNDAYQEYLRRGYSHEASYEKAEKVLSMASDIDDLTQKFYEQYVNRHKLEPDEALTLAKVKAKEAKDNPQEQKEKKEEKPSLNITKWYDDWAGNAWKSWADRFKPVTGFFDDDFFKDFEDLLGWRRGFNPAKGLGHGECKCKGKEKCNAPAKKEASVPSKQVDKVVEKEVKKVLDTLPEGEVNDTNTQVKITKGDPNDYEFRVEHKSPDGSSFSSYTRKYVKS